MPSYFSDLKSVYKRTYEELKNPNSAIAVFLEKIDEYERLENAGPIKTAIAEYIKVYEEEEKNFKEPDASSERIRYNDEQVRLRKNLEVEKKLEKAVRSMQDALDSFAEGAFEKAKTYTHEEIWQVKDRREQLRLQRDRMLDAIYGIEVDLEKEMIDKLKKDYQLFEHRPMESNVATPPFVLKSPQYKMRHMEINGSAKIPTAIYGLMRFRDLMNDHESMLEEAERSRQYEKFVNDRLAGYQAWKNTISIEQDIYNEIKEAVDPEYFAKYNNYMKNYAGTSTVSGYENWYLDTIQNIDKMKLELEEYQKQQEQLDKTYAESVAELEQANADFDLEEKNLNTQLEDLEKSPLLKQEYYDNNEKTRIQAEKDLADLEIALKTNGEEMDRLNLEESAAKQTMLENVQRIQNYSHELEQLQNDLTNNAEEALKKFLKKHKEVGDILDNNLKNTLDLLDGMLTTMTFHNEKVAETETAITKYTKEVQDFREQIDQATKAYKEDEKRANKELKAANTMGQKFLRATNLFGMGEKSQQKLEKAEDQKVVVTDYGKKISELEENIKNSEKSLAIEQDNLKNYKLAWDELHNNLKIRIKEGYEYSTQLQVQLSQLGTEKEEVTAGYENQVKEIQQTSKERQQTYSTMLERTSQEFDNLKEKKRLKIEERTKLQQKLEEAKKTIEKCKDEAKNIQNAKDSKEALLKLKEEFPGKRKKEIEKIEKEMEDHRDRSIRVKKLESERRLEIETTIKSHDAMFEFFKQGKVTSNRVLEDLSAALTESLQIANRESQKQLDYIRGKEMKLMESFAAKMKNPELFAERVRVQKDTKEVQKDSKEVQKDTKEKAGVYDYMKKLSSMKMFNSKSFENLKRAVMKNYSPDGTFLTVQIPEDEKERESFLSQLSTDEKQAAQFEKSVKEVRANLQELADCAKTYIQEKGSASRYTKVGKERYRFADEMRTMAETMLDKFKRYDIEKLKADKLKILDDSELHISKKVSFYKTEDYSMTRKAFVKQGEVDKLNMLGQALESLKSDKGVKKEGVKEEIKEKAKEEVKEEIVKEDDAEIEL